MIPDVFPWKHRHARGRKTIGDPVTIASFITLSRNIRGLPFPGNASPEQKEAVLKLVRDALGEAWTECRMEDQGELDRVLLEEAKFIPHGFAENPQRRSLFYDGNGTVLLVNGSDHLAIRIFAAGPAPDELSAQTEAMDTMLSEKLTPAFHPRFGFVTENPEDAGTGLHVSFLLHLPALVLNNAQPVMLEALKAMDLAATGFFGDDQKFPGNLFLLSNTSTMGETESEIISRVSDCAARIAGRELEVREEFRKKSPLRLMDFCARSRAVLGCARLISANEAMNALSGLKLAEESGLLPEGLPFDWENLLLSILPGHISALCGEDHGPEQRAARRANLLRARTAGTGGAARE